ncbi:MAG: hypothetical protein WCI21_09985 [Alphaproteobacteria bacterium]
MTTATFFERPGSLVRDLFSEAGRNIVRWILLGLGLVLAVLGVLMAPLPGPLGVPVTLLGLILILRNSFRLRRAFVRFQRRHPKTMFPLRKLLSKNPEVAAVAYHRALRIERTLLPKSWRVSQDLRHKYFRRRA